MSRRKRQDAWASRPERLVVDADALLRMLAVGCSRHWLAELLPGAVFSAGGLPYLLDALRRADGQYDLIPMLRLLGLRILPYTLEDGLLAQEIAFREEDLLLGIARDASAALALRLDLPLFTGSYSAWERYGDLGLSSHLVTDRKPDPAQLARTLPGGLAPQEKKRGSLRSAGPSHSGVPEDRLPGEHPNPQPAAGAGALHLEGEAIPSRSGALPAEASESAGVHEELPLPAGVAGDAVQSGELGRLAGSEAHPGEETLEVTPVGGLAGASHEDDATPSSRNPLSPPARAKRTRVTTRKPPAVAINHNKRRSHEASVTRYSVAYIDDKTLMNTLDDVFTRDLMKGSTVGATSLVGSRRLSFWLEVTIPSVKPQARILRYLRERLETVSPEVKWLHPERTTVVETRPLGLWPRHPDEQRREPRWRGL